VTRRLSDLGTKVALCCILLMHSAVLFVDKGKVNGKVFPLRA
jgi:hypothetical protein